MENFEVNILGCGSALPTVRHNPSSQVLSLRGKNFMIDCGEGTQLQLRRSKLRFNNLGHIFISHLHGDHCFGLIGLISTFDLLGRNADLHIFSPKGLEELLRPQLNFFCRGISFDVVFHTFSTKESELIFEDRSIQVTTIPLRHRMPCCGFFFQEKANLPHIRRDMIDYLHIPTYAINNIKNGEGWTTAEGDFYPHERLVTPAEPARSYAYLSDTSFVPNNATLVEGVDLLFHEATFAESETLRAEQTQHSTATQAAEFAQMAHAKKLVIGHFSSRYEDDTLLLKEAQKVFPNTVLARENLKIEI